MSIGILLVTHPGVGSALLATASRLINACPIKIKCLDVPLDANTSTLKTQADTLVTELDDGEGVLILTDLYGATPRNIASRLGEAGRVSVVSGVNLPMLMRVFNYFTEDLESLTQKAAEGGIRGIQITHHKAGGKP